ncbi:MAG: hypothetical protein J0H01_26880 [Rhizobiales bacterium]|nr:hypothetical protein [Hyphomicrobiales bacterium]
MPIDPLAVWASMPLKTWPERYWFVHVPGDRSDLILAVLNSTSSAYCCINQDQGGFSLVVDEDRWTSVFAHAGPLEKYGPLKVVSTDGDLPYDVTGFIKAALVPINGAGYKAAPQCGVKFDHFLVPEADIARVQGLFADFIASTRRAAVPA